MTRAAWQPGDPVGCGEAYLPTPKIRAAYHAAVHTAMIDAEARAILNAPEVATRRARIARYPEKWRDELKARVKELWEARS